MIISETRKAIIELIEPFMDKTLNFGCLVRDENDNYFHFWRTCKSGNSYDTLGINGEDSIERFYLPMVGNEIVGNYEMTAILQAIQLTHNKSETPHFEVTITYNQDKIFISVTYGKKSTSDYIGAIPNKPPHLYSDEQDEQLLEILTNLVKDD